MKRILSGLMVAMLWWSGAHADNPNNSNDCPEGSGSTRTDASLNFWAPTPGANSFGLGESVFLSGFYDTNIGQVITTTTNTDCSVTVTTSSVVPSLLSSSWEAKVGNFAANGSGLSASLTPTNLGTGSVIFHLTYANDVGQYSISVTNSMAIWANTDSTYSSLTDAQLAKDGINPAN